ncbi:MAG: hypothetical protein IPM39_07060 [Chloroflexi bacterium]|nr:hypothetical protein [Chloroflexota bacterium]
MSYTEIRPYPVPANVVMRTTLFALANMGAKLQAYNEETGVIVATVSKWLGLQQNDVIVRVRAFENTAQLEIEAPDALKAQEVLQLVAHYIADGAKIQANATMQWVDMQRQQSSQAKRKQLVNKARNLLPGASTVPKTSAETAVIAVDSSGQAIVPSEDAPTAAPVPIPDNPGVLVKNKEDRVVEIKIDPAVFTDRTAYVQVCEGCAAAVLRGSAYCSNCGRPLTLQAIQPELRSSAQKTAASSLTYGLAAIALNLIPMLLLILPPALVAETADSFLTRFGEALTPLKIAIAAVLGVAPSMVLGWRAIALAQRASWYRNLPAVTEKEGAGKTAVGNALGWLAIYLGLAWVLFVVIGLL